MYVCKSKTDICQFFSVFFLCTFPLGVSEGSPHENGHYSETKSRKMLPEVTKWPKLRGLGPYSKKAKFLGQNFFCPFCSFFGRFWSELYEGATFEQKVLSNICSDSERLYKTTWHYLKIQKKVFMNRSRGRVQKENIEKN